jgi:hypothetical protein
MQMIEIFEHVLDNDEVRRVRSSLLQKGYALTNEKALRLPEKLHEHIERRFYTDELLGREADGVPVPDRTRCRDVIECWFESDGVRLNEYERITMRPVADAVAPRQYNRTFSLDAPLFVTWLGAFLSLLPVQERQVHCTVGLNFVRTRNKVVGYKHQDQEEFVGIYVVARETEGAVTSLHPISDPDKTEIAVTLLPGDLLMFRDCDFMHDATPLLGRYEGDRPYRDAIVALVHYPTYFGVDPYSTGL